ncbi:MAG: OmpA family protein [Sandaracinaceae bacterium]|nr:OmpA family protein [Sandaracinaceae bacterium]
MRALPFLIAALLLSPAVVSAQGGGIAIDLYQAAETSDDGFAISRPNDRGHLRFGAQLQTDYGYAPLILTGTGAAQDPQLVSHLLGLRAGLSLGLIDRLVVFASLPVFAVMEGEQAMGPVPQARGGGLGDPTLGARVRLVGEPDDVGAVALQLTGSLPLAEGIDASQDLLGEGGVTFQPEVLGEVRFEFLRVTGNLGFLFRTAPMFANFNVEHELTWGIGVGATFLDDLLEARVEAFGRVGLRAPGDPQSNPAEAILGLRVRPIDQLVIGLAGGPGLGAGYGTPAFRGVLTIGWSEAIDLERRAAGRSWDGTDPEEQREIERQRRAALAAEAADREAREAAERAARETAAGGGGDASGTANGGSSSSAAGGAAATVAHPPYEELDRDGDRVVDARDHCPLDREDFDEIQDEDGCPEEDADGDQVADVDDHCPLTPGTQTRGECAGCPELACVSQRTGTIEITQRVEFDSNEATILASSEAVLRDVQAILQTNDQILRLRIEGHTDDRGDDEFNLDLSMRRAAAVVSWLVERGIARERLVGFGCGERFPLGPGTNARIRARNRRVEFLIIEPPSGREVREGCRAAE